MRGCGTAIASQNPWSNSQTGTREGTEKNKNTLLQRHMSSAKLAFDSVHMRGVWEHVSEYISRAIVCQEVRDFVTLVMLG